MPTELSKQFSAQERQEMLECFLDYDTDNSGALDRNEMMEAQWALRVRVAVAAGRCWLPDSPAKGRRITGSESLHTNENPAAVRGFTIRVAGNQRRRDPPIRGFIR